MGHSLKILISLAVMAGADPAPQVVWNFPILNYWSVQIDLFHLKPNVFQI